MSRLLVVHHTPSPSCQTLLEAVLEGAGTDELPEPVEVTTRPALTAGAADVLGADAVVLGTPANIGTMSGALKHFFDQIYYPCLQNTRALPFGLYVHGGDGGPPGPVNGFGRPDDEMRSHRGALRVT